MCILFVLKKCDKLYDALDFNAVGFFHPCELVHEMHQNISVHALFCHMTHINRDDHQNLKLLSIDLNQMHLIGLVERTILVFKSSKSDVSLQSYGL